MWKRVRNEDSGGIEYFLKGEPSVKVFKKHDENRWCGQYFEYGVVHAQTAKGAKELVLWILKQKKDTKSI